MKRITRILLTMALGLSSVFALYALAVRARMEFLATYRWDGALYWAMGRAILNGLKPYKDLFEFRPPGIFLVAAASIRLTGGDALGRLLEMAIAFLLTLLPFAPFVNGSKYRRADIPVAMFATTIFGALLSVYTMRRGGFFQVESFGAFFVALYAVVLDAAAWRKKNGNLFLLVALLFAASSFRELYLAVALAVALLFSNSWEDFRANFVTPLGITVVSAILALAVTGWLEPFVNLYLRTLFKHLIGSFEMQPVSAVSTMTWIENWFLNGLKIYEPFKNLRAFSFWFSIAVWALPSLLVLTAPRGERWALAWRVLAVTAITTIVVLSARAVDDHHFAMAAPVYLAFFLRFATSYKATSFRRRTRVAAGTWALVLAAGSLTTPRKPLWGSMLLGRTSNLSTPIAARAVDDLVDQCGARYAYIGTVTNGPIVPSLTRHSPSGPVFFQFRHFFTPGFPLRDIFLQGLRNADLVVIDQSSWRGLHWDVYAEMREPIMSYLNQEFTRDPWPCAGVNTGSIQGYDFYFRKGGVKGRSGVASL